MRVLWLAFLGFVCCVHGFILENKSTLNPKSSHHSVHSIFGNGQMKSVMRGSALHSLLQTIQFFTPNSKRIVLKNENDVRVPETKPEQPNRYEIRLISATPDHRLYTAKLLSTHFRNVDYSTALDIVAQCILNNKSLVKYTNNIVSQSFLCHFQMIHRSHFVYSFSSFPFLFIYMHRLEPCRWPMTYCLRILRCTLKCTTPRRTASAASHTASQTTCLLSIPLSNRRTATSLNV